MKDREIVVAVIIAYIASCEYAQRLTGWSGRDETFKVAPHQTIHVRATCTVSIDLFGHSFIYLANVNGLAKLLALGPAYGMLGSTALATNLGGRGEDIPEAKGLIGG